MKTKFNFYDQEGLSRPSDEYRLVRNDASILDDYIMNEFTLWRKFSDAQKSFCFNAFVVGVHGLNPKVAFQLINEALYLPWGVDMVTHKANILNDIIDVSYGYGDGTIRNSKHMDAVMCRHRLWANREKKSYYLFLVEDGNIFDEDDDYGDDEACEANRAFSTALHNLDNHPHLKRLIMADEYTKATVYINEYFSKRAFNDFNYKVRLGMDSYFPTY